MYPSLRVGFVGEYFKLILSIVGRDGRFLSIVSQGGSYDNEKSCKPRACCDA